MAIVTHRAFNLPQVQGQLQGLGLLGVECTILSLLVSALAAYFYVRRCSDPAAAWLFPAGVMAVEAAVTAAFWYRAAAGRSSGSMPALLMLLLLLFQQACGASTLRKVWLQQACSLPSFWPTILQIMLPEMFTILAYITTVATGVWRQPAARGQGPWWRPLLPAVVHAATCAAVVIRFTAAWPVIAIVAIAGLFLGSRGSTNAWQAVRERMPPSIATWGDQHVANGLFADVHAGFNAVSHNGIFKVLSFFYIVMAGFNVAPLFAVELPAWLPALLQGQEVRPAEPAAPPAAP